MKQLKNIIFSVLVVGLATLGVVSTTSCERESPEFIGPAVCPSDTFTLTTPFTVSPAGSIDFLTGDSLKFFTTFNEVVEWSIKIKGTTSGAVKSFEGNGDTVDVFWLGKPDFGSAFFENENCIITFKIACLQPQVSSIAITANDFSNLGMLIANFDGAGVGAFTAPPYGVYNVPAQSGIRNSPVPVSPQGGMYYRVLGNSGGTPTWFFGGTSSPIDLSSLSTIDPTKIYFNFYLNGNGKTNSYITVTFSGPGAGLPKNYNIAADWDGWQMVSFSLADAAISDPLGVNQIDIGLGTAPEQATTAEMNFDFVLISENEPFYN